MAKNLLKIAVDDDVADGVKLAATRDALDRAGLGAKTAVEVEVGPTKAYEQILAAAVTGGSRADSRSRRGYPDEGDIGAGDTGADNSNLWGATELDIIDAEVDARDVGGVEAAPRHRETPASPEPEGLMPLEQALSILHNAPQQ